MKKNRMLTQRLKVIPVLQSHLCPYRKVNRLQCISEAELFSKPSVMHSLNSNVKAISKHQGPRMQSKHRRRYSWVFRLRHEGVTGRSNASTWALCVPGCVSAVKWSFVRWGVKVRSPGGLTPLHQQHSEALSLSRYTSSLRNAVLRQNKHTPRVFCPNSLSTAECRVAWGLKERGGCQSVMLAEEVNYCGWRSETKEILKERTACEKYTSINVTGN